MASVIGVSGIVAYACKSNSDDEAEEQAAMDAAMKDSKKTVLSERDKLIVNRNKNGFADPKNPTEAELKHTPEITIGKVDADGFAIVSVVVGSKGVVHPATAEHWIDYLTFFVNDQKKSHIENENGEIRGFAQFSYKLKAGDIVKVESGCNLHGIWESSMVFIG